MSSLIRVSDAAKLALHATALLSTSEDEHVPAADLAERLGASEAHLAKVMQRLAHVGLVDSTRGPGGGYRLARAARKITLMQVYEAVEGPLEPAACMFGEPVCGRKKCVLGGVLGEVNAMLASWLAETKLSEAAIELEVVK